MRLRRRLATGRALRRLEDAWPDGAPFENPRLLRDRPGKIVLSVDSVHGPSIAMFFDAAISNTRASGVTFAHENLAEKLGPDAVPRVYHTDEEANLVVTERIEGDTLGAILKQRSAGDFARGVAQSGAWLRRLHDSVERPEKPYDARNRFKKTFDLPLEPAMRAELERLIDEIGVTPVGDVKFQADYKPHNVMVTGDRVVAIDLANTRFRPPQIDAGSFLCMAAANFLHAPRPEGPVNRIGLPLAITEPFDRGYGAAISTHPLTELKALSTLCHIMQTRRRPGGLLGTRWRPSPGAMRLYAQVSSTLL